VNYLTGLALVHYAAYPLNNKFIAQAIGVLVGLVFNFTLSKMLVFRGTA
jgi:putative flippase GtrA